LSHVYRSPRIWHLGAVYLTFGFSYIIYMTFFTKRLVADLHLAPHFSGDLFMLMGCCLVTSSILWGLVSDRIGRKPALVVVYCVQATAMALLALWESRVGATVSAVLFGLSALAVPPIMAAGFGDMLGATLAPGAFGFVTLFFGAGQALGPSVAGALADATGDFRAAFLVAAGVALTGGLAASLVPVPERLAALLIAKVSPPAATMDTPSAPQVGEA
jgi:MFS family permease